jgi:hypothetical protein
VPGEGGEGDDAAAVVGKRREKVRSSSIGSRAGACSASKGRAVARAEGFWICARFAVRSRAVIRADLSTASGSHQQLLVGMMKAAAADLPAAPA